MAINETAGRASAAEPSRPGRRRGENWMRTPLLRIVSLGLALVTLAACAAPSPAPTGAPTAGATAQPGRASEVAGRKLRVVTTVGMITDIVENVGKDRVEVKGLMGPGVDPHLYKATASDVKLLDSADIIFYGGLELEGRLTDTFVKMARSRPTVAVTEAIPQEKLREPTEFEGKFDPHVWFDVTLWQYAVKAINQHLGEIDPGSKDYYQQNADAYLKQLDDLHQYVKSQIERIPASSRVLITAHDAFGYFGQQYGVEVRGLQGTSTATEAGANDVQALTDFIAQRKIKAIFVETSVPESTIKAVQAAVKAKGHEVAIGGALFSDAMGQPGTSEGTYIGMVRHNVDTIVKALA
jgi:manganese/zinc/iron transport system substrate-binding protein